ncbi:MAG TPA: ThuA domain-containing protein [Blastocatellia bacterium]|nr:ThuA domain-containing protein [Blastocatellia bacterium]
MTTKIFPAIFAATLLLVSFSLFARDAADKSPRKPHIVFVSGDHEYGSEEAFPLIAKELETRYGFRATVLKSFPDENAEENIPGLEALDKADVVVLFLRWRRLPPDQLEHLRKYLDSGKPVVAFRTTTHAFNYPKGHELAKWNAFAPDYIGGPPGWGNGHYHYGHSSSTDVSVIPAAADHPILTGVDKNFHVRSWLYQVLPNYPPADAQQLLMGKAVNPEREEAVDNPVAWTWRNKAGGRVFVTTMGHPEDFKVEAFQRLVINGIHWAAGRPVPKQWAGKMSIDVKYHGIRKTSGK